MIQKTTQNLFILITAIFTSLPLCAQEAKIGPIVISGAYSKATVAGQTTGAGFMKITSTGAADQLVGVSSPVAAEAQLHSMSMEGNTMKMRQINAIAIESNSSVELTPGGLHIMFMGVKAPLKAGDSVKVRLKFASSGEVEVNLPVQSVGGASSSHDHMMK